MDIICAECGEIIDEYDTPCVIDEGRETERVVCDSCRDYLSDSGEITKCDACGAYFSTAILHSDEIYGNTFTPCPACGMDIIECMTREEFEAEYGSNGRVHYTIIVRSYDGRQRGYVVSVNIGDGQAEAIRKLIDSGKVYLDGVAEITVAEILLEEDVF